MSSGAARAEGRAESASLGIIPATELEPDPLEDDGGDGDARRLLRLYGADLLYVPTWQRWLAWDGDANASPAMPSIMVTAKMARICFLMGPPSLHRSVGLKPRGPREADPPPKSHYVEPIDTKKSSPKCIGLRHTGGGLPLKVPPPQCGETHPVAFELGGPFHESLCRPARVRGNLPVMPTSPR